MSDVWKHSKASGSALLVLLAVADFANEEGTAYPSIETLAKKARMSPRNARYVIGDLVKAGELVVKRNAGPKGCNLFKVKTANLAGVQDLPGEKFAGAQSVQDETIFQMGVQPTSAGTAIAVAPEPSLTVIEPSRRKLPSVPAGFLDAWQLYPKRAGSNPRDRALKAWRARIAEANTEDELLSGVRRYAAFVRATSKEGTEYVQQAATFFGPSKGFLEAWTAPEPRIAAAGNGGPVW